MPIILKLALIATVFLAACYDLRVRRIPNWISVSGLVLGLGINSYFQGLDGLVTAAGGMLAALCIYVPLYIVKGMGAGDVKLMAAVGAISGAANWFNIFVVTALLGGLAALALVLWRGKAWQTLANVRLIASQIGRGRQPSERNDALSIHNQSSLKMPHGAIIAAGVGLFLIFHWTA